MAGRSAAQAEVEDKEDDGEADEEEEEEAERAVVDARRAWLRSGGGAGGSGVVETRWVGVERHQIELYRVGREVGRSGKPLGTGIWN